MVAKENSGQQEDPLSTQTYDGLTTTGLFRKIEFNGRMLDGKFLRDELGIEANPVEALKLNIDPDARQEIFNNLFVGELNSVDQIEALTVVQALSTHFQHRFIASTLQYLSKKRGPDDSINPGIISIPEENLWLMPIQDLVDYYTLTYNTRFSGIETAVPLPTVLDFIAIPDEITERRKSALFLFSGLMELANAVDIVNTQLTGSLPSHLSGLGGLMKANVTISSLYLCAAKTPDGLRLNSVGLNDLSGVTGLATLRSPIADVKGLAHIALHLLIGNKKYLWNASANARKDYYEGLFRNRGAELKGILEKNLGLSASDPSVEMLYDLLRSGINDSNGRPESKGDISAGDFIGGIVNALPRPQK